MATQQTTGHLHLAGYRLPILALTGREALNRPCYLKVTCPTPLPLPGTELLNLPASVELQLIDGRSRWFHLQVQQLELISDGNDRAELRLASKLHQGTLQPRTRLMMDQTREQVLKHLLASMGYQPQELDLILEPGPAPDGPFLQVQETNLQCLQRLLAEVGANYWFEHPPGQDHETLVIRNNPDFTPYLPDIEWASAVSGLAPGDALNRITDAKGHWRWQPSRIARSVSEAHQGAGNASHRGMTELTIDQANHQTFDPPLGRDAAETRALYEQQRRDATRYTLSISSHLPLLTAGYCLPLDASSLPTGTLGGGTRGDFRILTVEHSAEADGAGLSYRNSATLIPRNDPVRPELNKPPALPPMFPARIESRYDHAELGRDGRYYFRLDADEAYGARQPYDAATHAQASPLTERLAPYASPEQDGITTGWHFPLLNRTTVLITCLNNDPARAMILGVIPSRHQIGPVTRDNAEQSRLVTPGQNELRFDDSLDAEAIALHSFDQQTLLALNAAGTEHYIKLAAQFGGLSLRAGKTLNLTTDTGNLDERIGGNRNQSVKHHSHSQIDGHQRHQAEAEHQHLAQFHLTQAAHGDFSLWVQQRRLTRRIRSGDRTTEIQHGDYQIQVSDGALVHQVNGDITIEGNGGGDLVLIKGDTGVKIDPQGNIKLFGKKITLHGTQSGVTFNGEVSYDIGGGNEPEDVSLLHSDLIKETAPITLKPFEAQAGQPLTYEHPQEEPEASAEPTVEIVTNLDGQTYHLSDRHPPGHPITPQFFDITVRQGETPDTIAWRYLGMRNARRLYYYNEQYSNQSPPQPGDTVRLPRGWAIDVDIRSANAQAITVELLGDRSSQQRINVGEQRVQFPLSAGLYKVIATAGQAEASAEFEVTEEQLNLEWLDFQALYNDTWQTPLPLSGVNILAGGTLVTQPLDVPVDEPTRQANRLFEQLPNSELTVEVPLEEGLEEEIDSLRSSVVLTLDGAYRDTVASMEGFQEHWDTYGYAAIAIDGNHGSVEGARSWLEDQASLLEIDTWKNLGDKIAEGTSKALDITADYAVERYQGIVQSANDASRWVDDNSDGLQNWNWWQTQAEQAMQEAREAGSALVDDVQAGLNDAAEILGEARDTLEKLYRYRNDILTLPDLIASGDVESIERFVDTILMDIDPELAAEVKDNPNYPLALALIADHDAALTYVMYLSLIFEAVPPNFYAYIAGKGGAYLALELLILALMSLLTLGVGTAARLTMIAARLSARSAQLAGASQNIRKAQQALDAFIRTINDIVDSLTTLEQLGGKLVRARNAGLVLRASPNTRLEHRKDTTRREQRCRLCHKTDHTTPRSLRGCVVED